MCICANESHCNVLTQLQIAALTGMRGSLLYEFSYELLCVRYI